MDTAPIINLFTQLLALGATVATIVTAFFVMLAGYQYMTAGGSVRAVESAKGSLYHAFIGLAIVILARVLANLVGGALGARAAGGMGLQAVSAINAWAAHPISAALNAYLVSPSPLAAIVTVVDLTG
jgi:hypothetical protein